MNWFEIHNYHGVWNVYKVTENGQCYTLFKQFKTEAGAKTFAKKHWVRRWVN